MSLKSWKCNPCARSPDLKSRPPNNFSMLSLKLKLKKLLNKFTQRFYFIDKFNFYTFIEKRMIGVTYESRPASR